MVKDQTSQARLFADRGSGQYDIVFDGGALGNPGKGYGSFAVSRENEQITLETRDYGDHVTNNEAEYQTLIEALTWLSQRLGTHARDNDVIVHGDSMLVINQMTGKWKIKNERIRALHANATIAGRVFRSIQFAWHGRENSVRVLGH